MSERPEISNIAEDPARMKVLEHVIGHMRFGLAGLLNDADDDDEFAFIQSMIMTASVVLSGMTAGHMVVVGALDEDAGDIDAFRAAILDAFNFGLDQGKTEAQRAIVANMVGGLN